MANPDDDLINQAIRHLEQGGGVAGGDGGPAQAKADPMVHMHRIDFDEVQRQLERAAKRQRLIALTQGVVVGFGVNFLAFTAALWVFLHLMK